MYGWMGKILIVNFTESRIAVIDSKPYAEKYLGHRKCQSVEYYLPWAYGKEDEPIETLFSAKRASASSTGHTRFHTLSVRSTVSGIRNWKRNSFPRKVYVDVERVLQAPGVG
jgi:hypothetical protein